MDKGDLRLLQLPFAMLQLGGHLIERMGKIADLLNKTEADKTPLQKQLDRLTVIIASVAGITFVLMILIGLNQGQTFNVIFTAGIALAISAIPTGMPADPERSRCLRHRLCSWQNR